MSEQTSSMAADWRQQLRKNAARTRWVIGIFFLIYLAIGLLIDVYIHAMGYSQILSSSATAYGLPPTVGQIFVALITFKITPWATIAMLCVAAISLWITYAMYDRMMLLGTEYVEVTSESKSLAEKQLYNTLEEMKVAAGMRYMPKVYIINADYMNAFASGYSEKSAMVAITRGLMEKLDRSELQAVMAHELSHIRHGDIRLTLTASVLSNIMLMAMDLLFYGVLFGGRGRNSESRGSNWLVVVIMIVRFVLPLVTVLLMLYLSRTREYMADAGSVELQRDNEPMIRALLKIHGDHQTNAKQYAAQYGSTAHESVRRESYIYDPVRMGVSRAAGPADWFSTHPGMKKRLAALGFKGKVE